MLLLINNYYYIFLLLYSYTANGNSYEEVREQLII